VAGPRAPRVSIREQRWEEEQRSRRLDTWVQAVTSKPNKGGRQTQRRNGATVSAVCCVWQHLGLYMCY
jgi:hypothetical protein